MEYTEVKNLFWCDAEHNMFNCEVTFAALGTVEFACLKSEAESGIYSHVTSIWERANAGEFGPIAEYVEPEVVVLTPEQQAALRERVQLIQNGAQQGVIPTEIL